LKGDSLVVNQQKLLKNIRQLLEEAEEIKKEGMEFLSHAPTLYEPLPPNVFGFPEYRWGNLNEETKKLQSEVIVKYKAWYNTVLKLINKYLPNEKNEFIENYRGKSDDDETVLNYLQLRIPLWNPQDIVTNFENALLNQINILKSLFKWIQSKIEDKRELNEKTPELNEKEINGTLTKLERVLIDIIFDFILKNPNIYRKNYRTIPRQRRDSIKKHDNYQCQLCGNYFNESELEVDHIYPYTLGGSNEEYNLMAVCKECNINKSKSLEYYKSEEGRRKLILNIKRFVRSLPIINNFTEWLKMSGDARYRKKPKGKKN